MKKLIFILMLFAISTQAQIVKKIKAFNEFTHCEVLELRNDGKQDLYIVDLGVMERMKMGRMFLLQNLLEVIT